MYIQLMVKIKRDGKSIDKTKVKLTGDDYAVMILPIKGNLYELRGEEYHYTLNGAYEKLNEMGALI